MRVALIVAGAVLAALVIVITLALCRAAAMADRQMERHRKDLAHEG